MNDAPPRPPSIDSDDSAESSQDYLLMLIDPAWTPSEEEPEPDQRAVLGGWLVRADGGSSRFDSNPGYVPSTPGSPLDPVDAVLQLIARGEPMADQLVPVLRDIVLGIALDDTGTAIVAPAPDGLPSVLVATSSRHRDRVEAAGWRETTVEELVAALPPEGVDVLLNPGAPASMRVLGRTLREALDAT